MRSLTRSITRTIGLLVVLQAAVIGTSCLVYHLPAARAGFFVLIALVYHAVLLSILLALRPLFVLERDDSPLDRVNASNALSLVRLSSLPVDSLSHHLGPRREPGARYSSLPRHGLSHRPDRRPVGAQPQPDHTA